MSENKTATENHTMHHPLSKIALFSTYALAVLLTGCSSVSIKNVSGELYSAVGQNLNETIQNSREYCRRRSARTAYSIRNISGRNGFPAYEDPNKVEVIFRCQDYTKPAPKRHTHQGLEVPRPSKYR